MKKSLIVSGLLFSGMILGSVATPAIVQAADTTTTTATTSDSKTDKVSNTVTFKDPDGKTLATVKVSGEVGTAITIPDDSALTNYYFNGTVPVFKADGNAFDVTVTKASDMANVVTLTVSYYLGDKSNVVGTETITGPYSTTKKVNKVPTGYVLVNASDANVNLKKGTESLSIEVRRPVANTVIFKTSDNQQVGTTTVSGEKVGDAVALTDGQIPSGYTIADKNLTLQTDGNTQIIAATKADAAAITKYKAVGTTGNLGALIYTQEGKLIKARGLGANTAWQIDRKLVLNGVTYYRVATNEFVKAADVTLSGVEDNSGTDNGSTDNGSGTVTTPTDAVKTDKSVVTTTSDDPTYLYKGNGEKIKNRALLPHSAWQASKMATINGVKMYKVATDEWVPASDVE